MRSKKRKSALLITTELSRPAHACRGRRYDISFAWPPGTARGDKARAMLAAARGVMAGDNVNSPARLAGLSKRWVAFNGAVGPQQALILKCL